MYVEESIRMTEDRDKWRKHVHGVANPRIDNGKRTEHCSYTCVLRGPCRRLTHSQQVLPPPQRNTAPSDVASPPHARAHTHTYIYTYSQPLSSRVVSVLDSGAEGPGLKSQLRRCSVTFNGPLPGTTQVSRYQKGKTNLDFTEARDSEWQWHQLGHMQVCTSLQTDNHASTPPLSLFTGRMPFLPPNQQRQSTEGTHTHIYIHLQSAAQ